ncbi:YdhK family protein [Paenibacillus ihumii]|uniref:YdhK family protein n=1 Tax=Paenibacillus ihumii TaxID=687436 RepID=UPI0006D7A38C|nr:YdhK family protein [Paenibacillus ihumii]
MNTKRITLIIFTLVLAVFLAACTRVERENQPADLNQNNSNQEGTNGMNHNHMNHSSSGELPVGIKKAANPKFKVGSKAVMNSAHMEGMNGAEATIVGAFDTIAYTISYTPATGGEKVTNHKWIIHEEIKDASDKAYRPGDEVIVEANHMEGMKGAKAVIDSAQQTTVYMVDYTSATGEDVKNHKWVTEDELSNK